MQHWFLHPRFFLHSEIHTRNNISFSTKNRADQFSKPILRKLFITHDKSWAKCNNVTVNCKYCNIKITTYIKTILLINWNKYLKFVCKYITRMHSSRMRTARLHIVRGGRVLWPGPMSMSGGGGVGGVGVGVLWPGPMSMSGGGGFCDLVLWCWPPPPGVEQNEWHMPVKT